MRCSGRQKWGQRNCAKGKTLEAEGSRNEEATPGERGQVAVTGDFPLGDGQGLQADYLTTGDPVIPDPLV